jgi:Predicted membrane protein
MNPFEIWLTIVFMGLVTYLPRLLPMAFLSQVVMPRWLEVWLKYVPTSIFGALIFSEIFLRGEVVDTSFFNPYLWAGGIAFGVAFFSRSLPGTIGVGCLAFWLIQQYIFPSL